MTALFSSFDKQRLTSNGIDCRYGGKRLGSLVFVDADACNEDALKAWLTHALGFVGKLPEK